MIIEQNNEKMFTKHPDRVEAYLLRIVARFFDSAKEDITNTREDIINETVTRVKQEILPLIKQIVIDELANQNK